MIDFAIQQQQRRLVGELQSATSLAVRALNISQLARVHGPCVPSYMRCTVRREVSQFERSIEKRADEILVQETKLLGELVGSEAYCDKKTALFRDIRIIYPRAPLAARAAEGRMRSIEMAQNRAPALTADFPRERTT
jgi:hypothetical protein